MIPRQFTQALRTHVPRRTFTATAKPLVAPRVISSAASSTPRHRQGRSISSTPEVNGQEPSHAAVREDIQIPYVSCLVPLAYRRRPVELKFSDDAHTSLPARCFHSLAATPSEQKLYPLD